MTEPLIQVVNEQDQPIGAATKQELWHKGLRHRVVRIMIHDKSGRILLQKRSPKKPSSPNLWDHSAAGHVDVGEEYTAAAYRELAEELGLSGVVLHEIGSYSMERQEGWRNTKRFVKVYALEIDADTKLTINPEEVTELRWVSPAELEQDMAAAPETFTKSMFEIVDRNLLGL